MNCVNVLFFNPLKNGLVKKNEHFAFFIDRLSLSIMLFKKVKLIKVIFCSARVSKVSKFSYNIVFMVVILNGNS